ncbi:DUF3152 domain-containing protein [Micromonosporaceae bacterium Da 78-11]
MIDEALLAPPTEPPSGADRWRRWWLLVLVLVVVVTAGFLVGRGVESDKAAPAPVAPLVEASTAAPTAAPTTRAPTPVPTRSPTAALLQLPGAVPTHGSGKFQYATRTGRILGGRGPVRRFRVGVETGSNENAADFADQVEATLGDPRSWTGGGLRLQLVGAGRPYDFTVYLATRDTAGEMCMRGGTNIRVGGVPYTSCRATGKAIINLDRWRRSAKPYLSAKVPLATYRHYVINHEVGHELGHHHVGCAKANGPAPVMVQQTLTVRGCVPYAWPRLGSRMLNGPSL